MKLCQDDLAAYASAAALLAVHCAISYTDALLVGLNRAQSHGEDHREAIAALRRACTGAKVDRRGIPHLEKLLGAKTDISYGDRQVDDEKIRVLCIAADRFQRWAEPILQRREGRLSS